MRLHSGQKRTLIFIFIIDYQDMTGSTRRSRSEHTGLDIGNFIPPGSRAQLSAMNSSMAAGYAYGGQSMGQSGGQAVQYAAAAAAAFGNIPPQIVIPRARHPNQVNYPIHRGQVYMW